MRITSYKTELDQKGLNILVKEKSFNYSKHNVLCSPQSVSEMMNDCFHLNRLAEEYVYAIALNIKTKPLGIFEISHGTCNASLINAREIFIRLLLSGASSFVLVHNHPSGDTSASKEDIQITKKIAQCSNMMSIEFLDHIIIGNDSYVSLKEMDLFEQWLDRL